MAINRFQAPDDATMRGIKAMGAPAGNRMLLPLPMAAPQAVESFDLTRNFGPSRSMVTGDRSLTRNPGGRAGLPLSPMSEQIGSRGMTPQRLSEIAGRRLSTAMRAGDMNATAMLYRGPNGFGRGFGPPPGFGMPTGGQRSGVAAVGTAGAVPSNGEPLPPPLALPPPMSAEQALGMPMGQQSSTTVNNGQPSSTAPMPMNLPWQGHPLPGVPMNQLPPSTFNGGAGLPPPAPFSVQSAGGWDAFTQTMPDGSTKFLNARPTPEAQPTPLSAGEMGRIRAAGFAPAEVGGRGFDAQGVPYLERIPQPVATEKITEGPAGTTRTYTQPRGAAPATPAATAQDRVNKLMEKAGLKPTASTQTGQMPNEAYAAPLNPAQLLEEARNEYARTGNDAALKQYFAQYPSEAVRLNQQEQQIWQQIAQDTSAFGRAADARSNAYEVRNDTLNAPMLQPRSPNGLIARINAGGVNPFTTGAKAVAYDAMFPARTQIAAGRDPGPPVLQAVAPPRPLPPMLPRRRNPEGIGARFDRYFNS